MPRPRRPAWRCWPATVRLRAACSRAARAHGPSPSWSSRWYAWPRPATLISGTRTRGREASGLGYLSGHAGVAVALGAAAFPRLSPSGRAAVAAVAPLVGLSRIYVGAHLPLDIAGGAALGLTVDAAVALVRHPSGPVMRAGLGGTGRASPGP